MPIQVTKSRILGQSFVSPQEIGDVALVAKLVISNLVTNSFKVQKLRKAKF